MPHRLFPAAPLAALLMLVALVLAPVLAPAARAADRANVEAFLEVTGFDAALESIAFSAADAPRLLGREPGDFGHDWARVSREVFDVGEMQETAIGILGATLEDDLLAHAAEFYASPLGRKLVAAENASHLDADDETKLTRGATLLAEAREEAAGRVAVLERMNAAVDGAGQSVRAAQEIVVRFMMAASHAGVLPDRLDEQALRALIRGQEDEMRAEMAAAGLANAAYTYRDLTVEELKAYASALEHPKMQLVYELMSAVQYEIMASRFETLAARMAEMHPGEEL